MRGKTIGGQIALREFQGASMRPPLNAGEDPVGRSIDGSDNHASMRPPLNAGEDHRIRNTDTSTGCASMRPPLNAGEDRINWGLYT